jgi:tetratricopeptide (TPR) repeat protein
MRYRLFYKTVLTAFITLFIFLGSLGAEEINKEVPQNLGRGTGLYFTLDELSTFRLENALRNMKVHSLVLIRSGLNAYEEGRKDDAMFLFKKAGEVSPDLPLPHLYLAWFSFSFTKQGLTNVVSHIIYAVKAYVNNFWWLFQTSGILMMSILYAFYAATVILIFTLVMSKLKLFLHDVLENHRRIVMLLPAALLAPFGLSFALTALLIPFWVYLRKKEKIGVCSIVLFMICMVFISQWLFVLLGALQDKSLAGIVKVNEGIYTGEKLRILSNGRGYEALFTYALDRKRKGFLQDSIETYNALIKEIKDARLYNNLANCYVAMNRYDDALKYYDMALKDKPLASVYYNLSQLYREMFDFYKAEEYYRKAIDSDQEKVRLYRSISGTSPNRFVMDESLNDIELWSLALKRSSAYSSSALAKNIFSTGSRFVSFILFSLILFGYYMTGRYVSSYAYTCARCGKIHCRKCEKRMSRENVCRECFRTMVRMGELTPQERVKKILQSQDYRNKRNNKLKMLTALFPGCGHVFYGRTGRGFLLIFTGMFFIISAFMWFFFPVIESIDYIAPVFASIFAAGYIALYMTTVIKVYRRIL